ncbi:hypothetical protein [uncultured Litoreibacter sp.]|uniref:hypothetical protein n=1 Tax=uncultured Litoreibacter sp. TaxID=1392394 RepID=UPI00262DC5D0|nr:hypothetical protein [uncultured Litoreibacter sp.]
MNIRKRQLLGVGIVLGSLSIWGSTMAKSEPLRLNPNAANDELRAATEGAFLGIGTGEVPSKVAALGARRVSYSLDNTVVGPDDLTEQLWTDSEEKGLILRFGLRRRMFMPDLRIMVTLKSKNGTVIGVYDFRVFAK